MPAAVVTGYKNLANVERDFRSIKTDDLDLRPIHHRLTERVKAHVLICLLACYLTWHLRQAWAPLTFTDEHPPQRDNPVAAAQRSPAAQAKASRQQDPDGTPLRSFRGLLDHLATLTRNRIRYHGTNIEIDTLTEPTPEQRRAFELIGAPSPSPSPRSQNNATKTTNPHVNPQSLPKPPQLRLNQALDHHGITASNGGTALIAGVEQPLHVVRRDRLRDTGVVTLGWRDRPRSRRGAPGFDTGRRRLRTPLQSEPTANDQPKPIGERPADSRRTRDNDRCP